MQQHAPRVKALCYHEDETIPHCVKSTLLGDSASWLKRLGRGGESIDGFLAAEVAGLKTRLLHPQANMRRLGTLQYRLSSWQTMTTEDPGNDRYQIESLVSCFDLRVQVKKSGCFQVGWEVSIIVATFTNDTMAIAFKECNPDVVQLSFSCFRELDHYVLSTSLIKEALDSCLLFASSMNLRNRSRLQQSVSITTLNRSQYDMRVQHPLQ